MIAVYIVVLTALAMTGLIVWTALDTRWRCKKLNQMITELRDHEQSAGEKK